MKAIFLVPGPDGGIYEYREVPAPSANGDLVLVKVRATGTNRGELLARPIYRTTNPALKPVPGGTEFAGEIAEVGPDATSWRVGERRAPASPRPYLPVDGITDSPAYMLSDAQVGKIVLTID